MITWKLPSDNLFHSKAEALVNTVNCVGVMGKGIALRFKELFPHNYRRYRNKCEKQQCIIGRMLVCKDTCEITGPVLIINFPTKKHWRDPSRYEWIELGLKDLISTIHEFELKSIAIPALGCSNGGLDWAVIAPMIEQYLGHLNCNIEVYPPH